MLLSNKLIYGDRLCCGSEAVAKRSLVLPDNRFINTPWDEWMPVQRGQMLASMAFGRKVSHWRCYTFQLR
ncbi:hypothetical protein JVU11DRAFT_10681 [Chiua virens]|nr:hypothetical protein JVU11DRAFT_10681 [Chiua virens]